MSSPSMTRRAVLPWLIAGSAAPMALVSGTALAAISDDAGLVDDLEGACFATQPGQLRRSLVDGAPVYVGDLLETGPQARLSLLLDDGTDFDLGPEGRMTLDTFIYDPDRGTGAVTASVLVGAFRFVSGAVAKQTAPAMLVRLPVGTIGVRGTHVAGEVGAAGSTVTLLDPEDDLFDTAVDFTNDTGTRRVDRPGTGLRLRSRGERIGRPQRADPEQLRQFFARARMGGRVQAFQARRSARLAAIRDAVKGLSPAQRRAKLQELRAQQQTERGTLGRTLRGLRQLPPDERRTRLRELRERRRDR